MKHHLKTFLASGYLLAVLLALPLIFLNSKESSNWGGDFAQYIHQAINIIEGIPQSENGYVYNPDYAAVSPRTYPIGFPIMLAPIYALLGNNFLAFSYLIGGCLFGTCVLIFALLRQHFHWAVALSGMVFVGYANWTLDIKGEVLSDIPFTMVLLLALSAYQQSARGNKGLLVNAGILAGFLYLIRLVGLALWLAIVTDLFWRNVLSKWRQRKPAEWKKLLLDGSFIFGPMVILAGLVSYILFPSLDTGSYLDQFHLGHLPNNIRLNMGYYLESFIQYFQFSGVPGWVQLSVGLLATFFFWGGLVHRLWTRQGPGEWLILYYLVILLAWPEWQGFRFIFPILPLIFYYVFWGISVLSRVAGIKTTRPVRALLFVGLGLSLCLHFPAAKRVYDTQNTARDGPQKPASVEAFNYIQSRLPEDAIIAFAKPRVLALYSGRKSFCTSITSDPKYVKKTILNLGGNYLLLAKGLNSRPLEVYIEAYPGEVTRVWKNEDFELYKRR